MSASNEQPVVANGPALKAPPSTLAVVCAVVAVIVSAVIAFCCTCVPLSLVFFAMQGGMRSNENKNLRQLAMTEWGELPFYFAWFVGTCVALFVGYLVYRALRKHWSKK